MEGVKNVKVNVKILHEHDNVLVGKSNAMSDFLCQNEELKRYEYDIPGANHKDFFRIQNQNSPTLHASKFSTPCLQTNCFLSRAF
jgi:hypothetical protein